MYVTGHQVQMHFSTLEKVRLLLGGYDCSSVFDVFGGMITLFFLSGMILFIFNKYY